MNFYIEPILDSESFLSSWSSLFERVSDASIYLSEPWIETWLEGTPLHSDVWSIKGEHSGETCLLGVFGGQTARRPPVIGSKSAHLHEFGSRAHDAIYIEYNDFLISPSAPDSARSDALMALLTAAPDWDELVLRNVRKPMAAAASKVASDCGLDLRTLNAQPTFAINIAAIRNSGSDVLDSLGASLRAQVRRSIRRYEERAPIRLKLADTHEERARIWDLLIRLHGAAWNARGVKGVFNNPALVDFHDRFMRGFPHLVHLIEVTAGEEPIGCLYNLIENSRILNYQSGFQYEADNRLKPGLVTHALAAQFYLDEGHDVYDLLAGDAEYKRRLAEQSETLTTLVLEKKTGARSVARRAFRSLRRSLQRGGETRQT